MTDTACASGAKAPKLTPSTPATSAGWAPSFSHRRVCEPSLKRWRSSAVNSENSSRGCGARNRFGLVLSPEPAVGLEMPDRRGGPTDALTGAGEVEVRVGVVGIEPDRLFVRVDCFEIAA